MSPPFRPAALTATRISPAPGTGSGCSSITISWSRMVAARTGRSLAALEQRDALDVVRLGKHVDGAHPLQRPARLDQFGRVRRERRRVARDVDDPLRR